MPRGIRIALVNGKQMGPKFKRSMFRQAERVRTASRATARVVAQRIEEEGRDDIASAGNFGSRWLEGWRATVTEGGGHIRVTVTMAVPYWTVFQFGKVIEGKPLLWIPLSFADDAKGVSARDYPGKLFRVDRLAGAPLLMTKSGGEAQAKYFGKESVTIPKKFHLLEILKKIGREIPEIYRTQFRGTK